MSISPRPECKHTRLTHCIKNPMLCYCNETITLSNKFCRVKYETKTWYKMSWLLAPYRVYLHKVRSVECLRETEGPSTLCYFKHRKNNLTTQQELFTTAPSLLPRLCDTFLHHRFASESLQIRRHHSWDQGPALMPAIAHLSKSNWYIFLSHSCLVVECVLLLWKAMCRTKFYIFYVIVFSYYHIPLDKIF